MNQFLFSTHRPKKSSEGEKERERENSLYSHLIFKRVEKFFGKIYIIKVRAREGDDDDNSSSNGGNFQISVKILNQVIYFFHYKLEIFLSLSLSPSLARQSTLSRSRV